MIVGLSESDREYVLGRLDRDHIAEVTANVRAALDLDQVVEACYQPGDGSWYSLVFAQIDCVTGGNGGGTKGYAPSRYLTGGLLIVYAQRGKVFDFYEGCDPEYAAAELSDNAASALAIAELLKAVLVA